VKKWAFWYFSDYNGFGGGYFNANVPHSAANRGQTDRIPLEIVVSMTGCVMYFYCLNQNFLNFRINRIKPKKVLKQVLSSVSFQRNPK